MKTLITTVAVVAALRICEASDTALTAADGTVYDHISYQRVDPDGLYIEYQPGGNGLGVAKVKFARLSSDVQKQYGYDAAKAAQFEAQAADADRAWVRAALLRDEAARKELAERSDRENMMEIEKLRATAYGQRATEAAPGEYYGYGGGNWPWLIGDQGRGFDKRETQNRSSFQDGHDRSGGTFFNGPRQGFPPAGALPSAGNPSGRAR